MKFYLFLLLYLFLISETFANIDSLQSKLINQINDSAKIQILNQLSFNFKEINSETGLDYGRKALELSIKASFPSGKAEAYKNIGLNYWRMGSYDLALENYYNSLSLFEELKNPNGIANANNYIGLIYLTREQHTKAIDYLKKSYFAFNIENNILGEAKTLCNLALVYSDLKYYDSALFYHFYSIKKYQEINDTDGIAFNYSFIGTNYTLINKFDSAYIYLKKAYDLFAISNSNNNFAMTSNNFALYYNTVKDFKTSLIYSRNSISLADGIGNRFMKKEAYEIMSKSFAGLKQFDSAYYYHIKFSDLVDTLKNDENIKSVAQKEMQYNYDKEFKKMEEARHKKEKFIKAALSIAGISSIIAILFFTLYKLKNKTNKILSEKNYLILKQKEELADLNATKDKFFSIIAHDLINPLGNFKEVTKVLYDEFDKFSSQEKFNFIGMMRDSSDHVYSLLDNLLEWSRTQRGTIKFNPIDFDLNFIVSETIEVLSLSANTKKIALINNIPKNFIIKADPNMLRTVIRNLISNSIKFSNQNAKITINSDVSDTHIKIIVSDSGSGMDEATMAKLFKIDEHITTPGTNQEKGTGLGLILSKEFVEKHNGSIQVKSELGKGSTFIIELPR